MEGSQNPVISGFIGRQLFFHDGRLCFPSLTNHLSSWPRMCTLRPQMSVPLPLSQALKITMTLMTEKLHTHINGKYSIGLCEQRQATRLLPPLVLAGVSLQASLSPADVSSCPYVPPYLIDGYPF